MPQLPNKKQEIFCRFVANGETYTRAYELAGYTPSTANASTLANRPEVAARIEELKEENERKELEFRVRLAEAKLDPDNPEKAVTEVVVWTVDMVRAALAENARLAQMAGEFKAAKESLELLGRSFNMFDAPAGKSNGNAPRAEVSLTLVQQAADQLAISGGGVSADGDNPLAPRVPSTRNPKRVK